MALLHNTQITSAVLGSRFGEGLTLSIVESTRSNRRKFGFGEHTPNKTSGLPNGTLHPTSWRLPTVSGGLSSYLNISGTGNLTSANLAGGLNAIAALTGTGNITNAAMQLVVSAIANIVGSGALNANLIGSLQAVASLAGSGNLTGAIGALANILASLQGNGNIAAASPTAKGFMSANLRGYSDLTPEGLRDAVWNALSGNFNAAGTMGNKLNSAASSGDPWGSIIDSGLTAQDVMQILLAVAAGKTSIQDLGSGDALVKFRNIADNKDVITANMSDSERTSVTLDIS